MRKLDLTGLRYGRLRVTAPAESKGGQSRWKCLCDCGKETVAFLGNLRRGHTISCGCERSIVTTREKTKHSMYGTPTYKSWSAMLTRCNNPKAPKYKDYGARGISVCEAWSKFEAFLADMGVRPEGTTLGRRDNDGNYEPGNCKWETAVEQGRNKRNTTLYEVGGIKATLKAHCERLGLNPATVKTRIFSYNKSVEEAFS